jgi:hypothetical protein
LGFRYFGKPVLIKSLNPNGSFKGNLASRVHNYVYDPFTHRSEKHNLDLHLNSESRGYSLEGSENLKGTIHILGRCHLSPMKGKDV